MIIQNKITNYLRGFFCTTCKNRIAGDQKVRITQKNKLVHKDCLPQESIRITKPEHPYDRDRRTTQEYMSQTGQSQRG